MPYALFSNDAKLSKTYPTEADVWKQAQKSGLVVDAVSDEETSAPRPVLDNDYEIRPCSRTRMKIPPGTRPTPSATPGWSRNWVREVSWSRDVAVRSRTASALRRTSELAVKWRLTASRLPARPARKPARRRPCAGAVPGSRRSP